MDRRDILKYAAAITGTTICAPLTATLLSGCSKQVDLSKVTELPSSSIAAGAFFNADEMQNLVSIMDVILPKTDTPSASEVNVHLIMDNMFNKVFKPAYKQNFRQNFSQLTSYLSSVNFASASTEQQIAILTTVDKNKDPEQGFKAYIDLKQQSIAYYLSTEEIAENHLNYLPIPGSYTPRISVQEVGGKAWAE